MDRFSEFRNTHLDQTDDDIEREEEIKAEKADRDYDQQSDRDKP